MTIEDQIKDEDRLVRCSPYAPGLSRSNPHDINHGR